MSYAARASIGAARGSGSASHPVDAIAQAGEVVWLRVGPRVGRQEQVELGCERVAERSIARGIDPVGEVHGAV